MHLKKMYVENNIRKKRSNWKTCLVHSLRNETAWWQRHYRQYRWWLQIVTGSYIKFPLWNYIVWVLFSWLDSNSGTCLLWSSIVYITKIRYANIHSCILGIFLSFSTYVPNHSLHSSLSNESPTHLTPAIFSQQPVALHQEWYQARDQKRV